MKIATFNINGIKARIEALPRWLARRKSLAAPGRGSTRPDVVCLQEIKARSALQSTRPFPASCSRIMGYHVETHGQKGSTGWRSCRGCRWRT
jgi:exodeoxyribonuclease-3